QVGAAAVERAADDLAARHGRDAGRAGSTRGAGGGWRGGVGRGSFAVVSGVLHGDADFDCDFAGNLGGFGCDVTGDLGKLVRHVGGKGAAGRSGGDEGSFVEI